MYRRVPFVRQFLPGHISTLHPIICSDSPESHGLKPPFCGGVQVRLLIWFPPPHVAEQIPHVPHSSHCPSTDGKYFCKVKFFNLNN